MNNLLLIIKGFIIGLGKIIPGVSGSLLAFSLGVYNKAILAINNFFKDLKNNIIFLGTLGLGVVLAILFGSRLIIYFLDKYYLYTLILFIGLICGTIPTFTKDVQLTKIKNLLYVFIPIILVFIIANFQIKTEFIPHDNIISYLYIIVLGFLDAATMIIPGISGTATFIMLGSYNFILQLFSKPFNNLIYTSLFIIGVVLGIFLISKLIAYLLKNYKDKLYLIIFGFSISTIVFMISKVVNFLNILNFIPCIILFILGFVISYVLEKI